MAVFRPSTVLFDHVSTIVDRREQFPKASEINLSSRDRMLDFRCHLETLLDPEKPLDVTFGLRSSVEHGVP